MNTKFGFSLAEWDKGKEEMRDILIARARQEGTISYSELVEKVRSIRMDPHSYALNEMLGEISSEEDEAGQGMLSVIVVYKDGDMTPGPGFFNLAESRGYDVSDRDGFWIAELKKVYAYWHEKAG